jgi:tetratricopeptide (TPR) repeat protein
LFAWYAIDSQLIVGKKGANDGFDLLDPLIQPVFGLGFYIWHTFWPVNLCPRYADFLPEQSLFTLGGAIAVLVGGAGVIQSWLGRRELFFGAAWFVMFLAPVLNFLPGNLLVADRYLYVSFLGLIFPSGMWLSRQKTPLVIGFVGCLLVVQLGLTRRYVPHWKDDLTLWTYIVSVSKENGFALTALAQAQIAHANYPAARDSLKKALTYSPCFTPIYLTYVEYERELGGADVLQLMSPVLSQCPGRAELMAASGRYWSHRQEYRKAETCYLDSLRFRSTIEVLKRLADVYEQTNEPEKGIEIAFRALNSYPFDEELWLTLGKLLELQGRIPQAETAYLQCIQFDPSHSEARFRLARIAFQRGDAVQAERWLGELRQVLKGKQLSDSAFTLWAKIYQQKKQYPLAIACLLEAVQVKSTPENWLNLIHLQIEAGQDPQPTLRRAIALHPEVQTQLTSDPKLRSVHSE